MDALPFQSRVRIQPVFAQTASHTRTTRAVRAALIAIIVAMAVTCWCIATHVSSDVVDANAVMALMEASSQRGSNARPIVLHDPHFVELTPVGLELIATGTRKAGSFAHIDEFAYRNADGNIVILLIAPAPFSREDAHWSAQRVGDICLLSWIANGRRHVLAGRAYTHGLMRAADALMPAYGRRP